MLDAEAGLRVPERAARQLVRSADAYGRMCR